MIRSKNAGTNRLTFDIIFTSRYAAPQSAASPHPGERQDLPNVEMGDLLAALALRLPKRDWKRITANSLGASVGNGTDPISAAALYPRWANFLKPDDGRAKLTGTGRRRRVFISAPSDVRPGR